LIVGITENIRRDETMSRKRILLVSLLLLYAVIVPVFAYEYFFRTDTSSFASGITLHKFETPTMKLGVYWDYGCTQSVASIDFGNMTHPNSPITLYKDMFIRNEGSVRFRLYWNSTLATVTNVLSDHWFANGTDIDSGYVMGATYGVDIPAYATVGTYNWTLNVWGAAWY
jgi:hypothetical protein